MTYARLWTFLGQTPADAVTVTGHAAPDTDAVVSALFEAFRRTLTGTPAVAAVQGALPREAAFLLGEAAERLPRITPDTPCRWVLTDHHDVAAYSGTVVGVVDHHPPAQGETLTVADRCIRPVGAATTLVAQRIRADGLVPDAPCARILLGAILLDTEGLSSHKATPEDREMAAWLSALCGEAIAPLYAALREQLLSETDLTVLYERDLREYPAADGAPLLRFAILKVRQDTPVDTDALRRRLAQDAALGYAATVAKIVRYAPDDSREEYYIAAGAAASLVLEEVLRRSGPAACRRSADEVYLPPHCAHWGRKRYALWFGQILKENSEKTP